MHLIHTYSNLKSERGRGKKANNNELNLTPEQSEQHNGADMGLGEEELRQEKISHILDLRYRSII